jgi:hypothetical protein
MTMPTATLKRKETVGRGRPKWKAQTILFQMMRTINDGEVVEADAPTSRDLSAGDNSKKRRDRGRTNRKGSNF